MPTNRMIRIFVSSVFTAFENDRNVLDEQVFKPLKTFCEKQGFVFQAIDLRWGISDALASQYETQRLCLEEIKRCQRYSPKPNFLILSGERYGWTPLPSIIRKNDFTSIRDRCDSLQQDILDALYFLDKNDLGEAFHLRPSVVSMKPDQATLAIFQDQLTEPEKAKMEDIAQKNLILRSKKSSTTSESATMNYLK